MKLLRTKSCGHHFIKNIHHCSSSEPSCLSVLFLFSTMPSTMHTNFIQVMVHTAKCDTCDNHNTLIIYRCADCGIQCCTPCWQRRGGDDNHVLNGGDRGWTGKKINKTGKERSRAIPKTGRLAKSKQNNSGNRPKGIVKRKYVRNRKAVVDDENETEEEEAREEISPVKGHVDIQRSERYPRRLSTQNPKTKQQKIPAKVVNSHLFLYPSA